MHSASAPKASPADDPDPGEVRDGAFVQSLERGLAVIRALSQAPAQSLSEVARSTGLTRASARRFLLTLERLGYVRREGTAFSLTPQVLELGHAYLTSLSLPEVAGPHLARLVDHVHQSSSVAILDGQDVVYVARVAARRIMSVSLSIGTRFPAHQTSMGRVLLAALEPTARAALLDELVLEPRTPRTIVSRAELAAELDRVREQGYALVDEELELGLRSIAAPVRGKSGRIIAAMNLSVPAATHTVENMLESLLDPLRDAAASISRDLELAGFSGP